MTAQSAGGSQRGYTRDVRFLLDLFFDVIVADGQPEIRMVMCWTGAAILAFAMGYYGINVWLVIGFVMCVVAGVIHTRAAVTARRKEDELESSLAASRRRRRKRRGREAKPTESSAQE